MFTAVQHLPDFSGCMLMMIKIGDEARDGVLEVDVVLPQRVVGVDEKSLA
jgi:hypothetical protein